MASSFAVPYQVPYQNQLQFNLGVPLTAQNLAVQFSHPPPIFVERVGGQHVIPGKFSSRSGAAHPDVSVSSVFNYSTLSEDKMEKMAQLAKRDLRNRKLQLQMRSESSESISPLSTPSHTRLHPRQSCRRFERQKVNKARHPLTAREAEKNRRFGAVQTPPPRRPTSNSRMGDDSILSARNTSMNISKDSEIHFPAKPVVPEGTPLPTDEVTKLQHEMQGYLLLVEQLAERAIAEGGTKFLHPSAKVKQKDGYLMEEEDPDRVRVRASEQNTRSVRNMYNLRQKVKQLQRDVAHADLAKPAKKSQISTQLGIVHRGAVKAVQTFANHLPYQDLKGGLPSHFQELGLLLRQLTALSTLTQQGKKSEAETGLLSVLDRVDSLNTKWCAQLKKSDSLPEEKEKKAAVISKEWVSDTKVEKEIFRLKNNKPEGNLASSLKKLVGQPSQQLPKERWEKRAPGKENKIFALAQQDLGKRKPELRAAVSALLQAKAKEAGARIGVPHVSGAVAWEVEMGKYCQMQDPSKGYLLPSDLIAKREKAQRAVASSNQEKRFSESTLATRLKSSPNRPSSAPASPGKRKEVNFNLDRQSQAPRIPPGTSSRSQSLSSECRSRSRSPFYLWDVDKEDVRHMFPGKLSLKAKKSDHPIPSYGFHSVPTEKKLRSADVSNSFIDEVEHRLLQRLLGKRMQETEVVLPDGKAAQGKLSRKDLTRETTGELDSEEDDGALDVTDLDIVTKEAVSVMDAPTLENIKARLAEMQREQKEIRQRWSSFKFADTKSRSRLLTSSDVHADRYRDPPAIEITHLSKSEQRLKSSLGPVNKDWAEEPLIFTKSQATSHLSYLHTVNLTKQDDFQPVSRFTLSQPPRKLVTMKQTTVEKIAVNRDRFDNYLRKKSHHPAGKFDPWKLIEEISDEILSDCLKNVAAEVEVINEEIANHLYKAEFLVDRSQLEASLQPSPQAFPVGDKPMHEEQAIDEMALWDVKSFPVGGGLGSGDQPVHITEKSRADSQIDSGNPAYIGDSGKQSPSLLDSRKQSPSLLGSGKQSPSLLGRQSPNFAAAAPLLEDVSNFLYNRKDTSDKMDEEWRKPEEENSSDNEEHIHEDKKDKSEDDGGDDDKEEEENYSDDDFTDESIDDDDDDDA